MNRTKCIPLFLGVAILSAGSLRGADAPTTSESPKHEKKAAKTHEPRLWGIYAKMTDLTPEQKEKMAEIHKKTAAEKKDLDDEETASIAELLTPDQKTEMETISEKEKVAKKTRDAEKAGAAATHPADAPTTAPATPGT